MAVREGRERPRPGPRLEAGVLARPLDEPVVAVVVDVVVEHVEDEALLDGLPHRVEVERAGLAVRAPGAEDVQGGGLRGRREREERDVRERPLGGQLPRDPVLGVELGNLRALPLGEPVEDVPPLGGVERLDVGERLPHLPVRVARLGGVGLVDDDGERPPRGEGLVADVGELLDSRGDDLGARLDRPPEVLRPAPLGDPEDDAVPVVDREHDVGELGVELPPVGEDDDRVEHRRAVRAVEARELVGEPGDGVRLARARRVLYQVVPAGALLPGVCDEPPHAVALVVAGEDDRPELVLPVPVPLLVPVVAADVLAQDLEERGGREDVAEEVVGAEALALCRLRVAGAAVLGAAVVREEAAGPPAVEPRDHGGREVVHREVGDRAAVGREERLAGATVSRPLALRVLAALARGVVLQLEQDDGDAVHEQGHVDRVVPVGGQVAVAELAHLLHHVGAVEPPRPLVPVRRGLEVGEVEVRAAHAEPLAEGGDDAALPAVGLEPRGEGPLDLCHLPAGIGPREAGPRLGLRGPEEALERVDLEGERAVVALVRALLPPAPDQDRLERRLERVLGHVDADAVELVAARDDFAHHATPGTLNLPVTASLTSEARYSLSLSTSLRLSATRESISAVLASR